MREIELTNGGVTIVDDDVFAKFGHMKWRKLSDAAPYATAWFSDAKRSFYLHRLIMDAPAGMVVDHIDRDPLNNLRSNLRVVTKADDLRNRINYTIPNHLRRDPNELMYRSTNLAEVIESQGRMKDWIAKGINVSRGQVSHILAGRRKVTKRDAQTIADMLSVPLFLIFELADASDTLDNKEGRAA